MAKKATESKQEKQALLIASFDSMSNDQWIVSVRYFATELVKDQSLLFEILDRRCNLARCPLSRLLREVGLKVTFGSV